MISDCRSRYMHLFLKSQDLRKKSGFKVLRFVLERNFDNSCLPSLTYLQLIDIEIYPGSRHAASEQTTLPAIYIHLLASVGGQCTWTMSVNVNAP